jgi:hypothetical protein
VEFIGNHIKCTTCGAIVEIQPSATPVDDSPPKSEAQVSTKAKISFAHILCMIVGVFAFFPFTWPVSVYYWISSIVWWTQNSKKGAWSKAVGAMAGPMTIGLGLLVMVTWLLNLDVNHGLGGYLNVNNGLQSWLDYMEDPLVKFEVSLRKLKSFHGVAIFMIVISILLFLSIYLKNKNLVARGLTVKSHLGRIWLFVYTFTCFTFFGQDKLENLAASAEKKINQTYQAALRINRENIGEHLIADSIIKSIESDDLKPADKKYFCDAYNETENKSETCLSFQYLPHDPANNEREVGYGESGQGDIFPHDPKGPSDLKNNVSNLADYDSDRVIEQIEAKPITKTSNEKAQWHAKSLDEWHWEQQQAEQEQKKTNDTGEAVKSIFRESLSSALSESFASEIDNPELKEFIKTYIKKVIENYVDKMDLETIKHNLQKIVELTLSPSKARQEQEEKADKLLHDAQNAMQNKQYNTAIDILNILEKYHRTKAGKHSKQLLSEAMLFKRANYRYDNEYYAEAIQYYDEIISKYPNSPYIEDAKQGMKSARSKLDMAQKPKSPIDIDNDICSCPLPEKSKKGMREYNKNILQGNNFHRAPPPKPPMRFIVR